MSNWYKRAKENIFYHGTTTVFLPDIKKQGLLSPYLCDSIAKASYYAGEVASEGGRPVVFRVAVPDPNKLRYDGAAMDEPVMASEADRNRAWNKASKEHPEWIKDGFIVVPRGAWQVSWSGVGSVWYQGTIPWANLTSVLPQRNEVTPEQYDNMTSDTARSPVDQLDEMQSTKNNGRGVSCVKTFIFYWRENDYQSAKAVYWNEHDKISSYPDLKAKIESLLKPEDVIKPMRPIETKESKYHGWFRIARKEDPWGVPQSHDYDPNWDYQVIQKTNQEAQKIVNDALNRYRQDLLPKLKIFRDVQVNFVRGGTLGGNMGKYVSGTSSMPIIVLDLKVILEACKRYDLPLDLGIETTILHELGHAIQEAKGLAPKEYQAEDFAHTYYDLGRIIDFGQ